jgi:hypothetical protein
MMSLVEPKLADDADHFPARMGRLRFLFVARA